jgi:modification methylase
VAVTTPAKLLVRLEQVLDRPLELPLDQILRGDCVQLMRMLPPASVDCVFADPPYNLQLRGELRRPDDSLVDGVDEDWDRFADFPTYDAFTRDWLGECRRVLRKDGTIWVIGAYHNIFRIGAILQDLGFWILNDVIWRKANPMPNFRGRRFTNAHETLIWAARSRDARYRFNYQAMKSLNDDIQMRSDWFIPLCTGQERLQNGHGLKLHPTQKPEALLHRVLLASTNQDDVVLDPFAGTGTTPAVAKRLRRHFIGIERHPAYAEAAIGRVRRVKPVSAEGVATHPTRRDIPRIPFGSLVEQGLIAPGTTVFDRQRRVSAMVGSDGSLSAGDIRGSIHKVGAALQNAPSCNGWTFWHFERDGTLLPLDVLRATLAAAPPVVADAQSG